VAARERKRRSPGEGSVWLYRTKAGQLRYALGYVRLMPDGTRKAVTRRTGPSGERWTTERDAKRALRQILAAADKGELIDPSRQPVSAYLGEWLDGLRLAPSTVASYRKNVRLHIEPYIGAVPLASLTTARIDALYRQLERGGRADYKAGEGLSARTVRYVHTILSAALAAAVRSHRLARNPAATATPPSARQARAPEMHPWDAAQLAAFLGWSAEKSQLHAAWTLLAMTGMRRGEALALRWRDVDLDAATVSVRRSAGVVRVKGEGAEIAEGGTKSGKPRVIDLDAATVAVLRAHRKARGGMALQLARDDALVFGDHEGRHLHPERFTPHVPRRAHPLPQGGRRGQAAGDPAPRSAPHPRHASAGQPRADQDRFRAARPRQRDDHDAGLRARAPRLPARSRRAVRCADREGESTMTRPETSERHHGPFPAGRVPLSPARMLCPRGDLNPHALNGH
jgi:integrase